MATVSRLPSGLWQACVVLPIKLPSGRNKRTTKTHPLKRVVVEWATGLEAAIAAGTWLDPKAAETTLGEYRAAWVKSRIADGATSKKNASQWSNHVEPVWAGHPLGLITRPELKTWVKRMHTEACPRCRAYPGLRRDGRLTNHKTAAGRKCSGSGQPPGLGAWTIQGAVSHLSGLLTSAVEDGLIPANPALRLNLPPARPKPPFYWSRPEAAAILLELGGADALAVDLDMHVGFRPGELFGLRRWAVDLDHGQIHVHGVATRDGWREWAKTSKSHRATPIPKHLRERMAAHVADLGPDDLVFPAREGGLWDDRNFAQRVFTPAIERAGVRAGTPYDMRHTAASWLVQAGVDLQRVQELLGHEKYSTTLRYAHLRPGAYDAVLDAWGDVPLDPRSDPMGNSPSPPQPHEPSGNAEKPRPPGTENGV